MWISFTQGIFLYYSLEFIITGCGKLLSSILCKRAQTLHIYSFLLVICIAFISESDGNFFGADLFRQTESALAGSSGSSVSGGSSDEETDLDDVPEMVEAGGVYCLYTSELLRQ